LPKNIEKHLELVADPLLRTGATTDTESFPEPAFSGFRVSQNQRTITFRVCLSPAKRQPAGKYVGTINLDGPSGLESDALTITANAKDGRIFWASTFLALLIAFLILLYKGATDEFDRLTAQAGDMPDGSDQEKAAMKAANDKIGPLWKIGLRTFLDVRWLVPTLFAVGGALGALWGVYDANPSWGDSGPITSAFAIIGAALAAIGARTIFTGGK